MVPGQLLTPAVIALLITFPVLVIAEGIIAPIELIGAAAIIYFVLPADAIPDFVFGLGFTDDVAVLTAATLTIAAHLKPSHRAAARAALADNS